jgi:sugar phosphate isomerase/epimerase
VENLKRLGLFTELGMVTNRDELSALSDLAISAHAPLYRGEIRLNIAATDDEFRQMSFHDILGYIDLVKDMPKMKKINMHPSPKQWLYETQTGGRQGDYGLMIEGIRRIADHCAESGLDVVLENNSSRWTGVPDDLPADQVDWANMTLAFGSSPEEWIQVCEDVDRPNVFLCLDSSHACTYAHTIVDPELRAEAVMAYLARPDLIDHVHWNDNYLYDTRGREDSHAVLGKGTLPVEMHRGIKALDATLMIEHFYTIEELEQELEYVEGL